jgi:hypothetical protein
MSYCTLDEAFGSPYLSENGSNYDKCVKRSKVRKKKINCNEKKSRFNSNLPDVKLNTYNPRKHNSELLNSNNNAFPHFPKNFEPFTNFESFSNNENDNQVNVTTMSNNRTTSSNNRNNNSRNNSNNRNNNNRNNSNNRNNNNRNNSNNRNNNIRNNSNNRNNGNNSVNITEPNEIFEYSEEDNLPMNSSSDYEVVSSEEETDEETELTESVIDNYNGNNDFYKQNNLVNLEDLNNSNNSNNSNDSNNSDNSEIEITNNDSNNLISSQISEINNKISFIMNQINKEDNETTGTENNVHDMILFIIFGVFVLLILESLYKMISRVLRTKHGMSINLS